MIVDLLDSEWHLLANIPEQDLIEAAVDLDILVPEIIDARQLLGRMIPSIIDRARAEGLPLSKYDRVDLEAMAPHQLAAIASLQGLAPTATVSKVLRAGARVYRTYTKTRPNNAVAILLPSLLPVIARVASDNGA